MKKANHKIFGTPGSEYWYSGKTRATLTELNDVWDEIESKTDYRKTNHTEWPFTEKEKKKYAILMVEDFTENQRTELESPLVNALGNEEKRCKYSVDYKELNPQTVYDISNIADEKEASLTP